MKLKTKLLATLPLFVSALASAEVFPVHQTIAVSGTVDSSLTLKAQISRVKQGAESCIFDVVPICIPQIIAEDIPVSVDAQGNYSFQFNTWEKNAVFETLVIYPIINNISGLTEEIQDDNFILVQYSNPSKLEPGYNSVPSLASQVSKIEIGTARESDGSAFAYSNVELKDGKLAQDVGQGGPGENHGLPILMLEEKNAPVHLVFNFFRSL